MSLAIEIGPGRHAARVEGDGYEWTVLDYPDFEWGSDAFPWMNPRFDLVYAAHVLEHVPWMNTGRAPKEAYRILKVGGAIELWVPDFEYLVTCYVQKRCGDDWRHENDGDDPMTWLNGRLYTYGPEPNFHKACFDANSLGKQLLQAGFRTPIRIDPDEHERGHRHGRISMGLRAWK